MANIFKMTLLSLFLTSCTSLIYQPDKALYAHPDQFKTKFEVLTFKSLDGTNLSAWKLLSKNPDPKKLVVFFHGNAQNLTSHFVNLVWLTDHDYDVLIFDYRGYGLSEGEPNPKGVAEDGIAFLNYGYEDFKKGGYEKFIVYTQSLGGAIALKSLEDFPQREEITLLVLDSTFLSPRDVAYEKYNGLVAKTISNAYTADPKLKHLNMPVLSIHSMADPVVPFKLGEKLQESLPAPKKEFWILKPAGHGDVYFIENERYRAKFIKYVESLD
jgi:pimeloyl-ACP methyl ester carboxylesterase